MKRIQKLNIKNQNFRVFLFVFSLFTVHCSLSTAVFAAEEAGHGFSFKDIVWPVVNFAILVVVLFLAGRKPFSEYFKKRTEMIEKSIKDAEEAKEIAKKSLEEVRARLKNVDLEINDILKAAKQTGEKEKEALIAEGMALKTKILEQAKSNIEFELQKAKKAIKSEAAIMALELAEKQIKERLGTTGQEKLIDEYVKKLEIRN